ncbi:MAG: hypothetical protein R3E39_11080 [Anaerolineae bacterium]
MNGIVVLLCQPLFNRLPLHRGRPRPDPPAAASVRTRQRQGCITQLAAAGFEEKLHTGKAVIVVFLLCRIIRAVIMRQQINLVVAGF